MKRRGLSDKEGNYWANVLISVAQVLFGIAAVTFFAGVFDLTKVVVILFNVIVSTILWLIGWRLMK
jgi:hypothetical protein